MQTGQLVLEAPCRQRWLSFLLTGRQSPQVSQWKKFSRPPILMLSKTRVIYHITILHDPVPPFLSLHNPLYSQFTPSLLPFPHLFPPPPLPITVNLLLLIGPKFLLCDFQRTIIDSAPNSNHKLTIIIFTFHLNRDKGIWHSSPMKAITDRSQ